MVFASSLIIRLGIQNLDIKVNDIYSPISSLCHECVRFIELEWIERILVGASWLSSAVHPRWLPHNSDNIVMEMIIV